MAAERYDLIVIGSGPGGHIAAERAGALGKKVLVVEKADLGGVCLNRGCIPTKTLLASAKLYAHARQGEPFGVFVNDVRYDLARAMEWKAKVVDTLRKGIAYQFRRFGVELAAGEARIVGRDAVEVGGATYRGERILVATGSSSARLPVPTADGVRVLDSTSALELGELPSSIVVIGGGYIGMEFASFFSQVGAKVSVVEMLPEILPMLDAPLATLLRRSITEVSYHLGATVTGIQRDGVHFVREGKEERATGDAVLVAVGRRPNVESLGLERIGVDFDRTGIRVDERMRTNIPGVYAIGDVTGRSMLAHAASRMAEVAVETMFGGAGQMRYHAIPWVVYTNPEAAGVGMNETEARAAGHEVATATVHLRANPRSVAEQERPRGMATIVTDARDGLLLGFHMVGNASSEIVYGAAAMIEAELRVKDIREIVFPHPTVSEIIRDAVWEIGH